MANQTFNIQITDTSSLSNVENIGSAIPISDGGTVVQLGGITAGDLSDIQIAFSGHPTSSDKSITLNSNYAYSTLINMPNNGTSYSSSFLDIPFNAVKAVLGSTPDVIWAEKVTQTTPWSITSQPMLFLPGLWTQYEIIYPTTLPVTIYETHHRTWYRKKTCWPYGFSWVIEQRAFSGVECSY